MNTIKMMTILTLLVALSGCGVLEDESAPTDVTGEWTGSLSDGEGTTHGVRLTMEQTDDVITGFYRAGKALANGRGFSYGGDLTGTVSGSAVTLNLDPGIVMDFDSRGNPLYCTVLASATIERGSTLSGNYIGCGGDFSDQLSLTLEP
jgi:hypothetical protein